VRAFRDDDGGTLVHLHNVSGGVLGDDRLSMEVSVDAGARVQLTTTGATRIYRNRAGSADSEQSVSMRVGEGALLEYLPDVVIPFAGSRHVQRTSMRLERGATLCWWETLAPGRQAHGERFAFERLRIESNIHSGGRPLLRERFLLEPAVRPLSSIARMGEYTHLATFYAVHPGAAPEFWRELENKLNEAAMRRTETGRAVWGASTLTADGVLVRGLAMSHRDIPAALAEFWSIARRFITGEDAVPPRKVH
jgi:urease accessory protein